ncbi:MAG: peptidylprolyl isomerase [Ferruginibacter sp.]|nr:peptidylprolyl isomerase [Ferruginibacter sp.]
MQKLLPLLLLAFLLSCSTKKYANPHVLIETGAGDIEIELFPAKAPKTCAAFMQYVEKGLYKNSSFYRVIKNEDLAPEYNSGLIQGGIHHTDPATLATLKGTPHESPAQTGLSHTDGTVSLARTTPGSGSSEFFICIGDQRQFDSSKRTNPDGLGYAAFGHVVSGMKVVRDIQSRRSNGDEFLSPVSIKSISIR